MNHIIKNIQTQFLYHAHKPTAAKQQAYMKHISPFLGITTPIRRNLQKQIFKQDILSARELTTAVQTLWDMEEREYAYAALDLLIFYRKIWTPDFLKLFEQLIHKKPWWDTIDTLAAHCVGYLVYTYPDLASSMDTWITHDLLWKRRVALLHQLRYKKATNRNRLARYCSLTMHEREFFIAKAIGWALREYSKTDPVWVNTFIQRHGDTLAPLSIREGIKYCV